VREFSICRVLTVDSSANGHLPSRLLGQIHKTSQARQVIYRSNERSDAVTIICEGWAYVYSMLSDGRRQILSILLPGDIVTATAMLKDRASFSIQALTDIDYCQIDRTELKRLLVTDPTVLDEFFKILVAEKEEADQLVIDLGRRTADERIARFILGLMNRLQARQQVQDNSFAFPVRQQHIADATGLTSVHVSRVIGAFRKAGLVEIKGRSLKILNLNELKRISNAA